MAKDSFEKMRQLLDLEYQWPATYSFKFIVPAHRVEQLIEKLGEGELVKKNSRTGKYISVTIHKKMTSTEEVIEIYQNVSSVEGVISL